MPFIETTTTKELRRSPHPDDDDDGDEEDDGCRDRGKIYTSTGLLSFHLFIPGRYRSYVAITKAKYEEDGS